MRADAHGDESVPDVGDEEEANDADAFNKGNPVDDPEQDVDDADPLAPWKPAFPIEDPERRSSEQCPPPHEHRGTEVAQNVVAMSIVNSALIATASTTAAIAAGGAVENGDATAPLNAVSHMVWGEEAAVRDGFSLRYTLTGAALNAGAMLAWAAFHQVVWRPHGHRSNAKAFARGAATAGIAFVVDYCVVPARLTPGFEKRLSKRSLFAIYLALAVSLAAGECLSRMTRNSGPEPLR
jgi:hypothetical protein